MVIHNTDLGHQEGYQNILVAQEVAQKLKTLGYLESLQESEIEKLTILQGVGSSEVKGVLPRKREVRPVGIEPTTLDLGSRTTLESEPLETKHDEHFTNNLGYQECYQNFQDERFAELARAWSTLPKSTQLGIIALFDIAKTNSQDRGLSGIIGTMHSNPRAGAESPALPERENKPRGCNFY